MSKPGRDQAVYTMPRGRMICQSAHSLARRLLVRSIPWCRIFSACCHKTPTSHLLHSYIHIRFQFELKNYPALMEIDWLKLQMGWTTMHWRCSVWIIMAKNNRCDASGHGSYIASKILSELNVLQNWCQFVCIVLFTVGWNGAFYSPFIYLLFLFIYLYIFNIYIIIYYIYFYIYYYYYFYLFVVRSLFLYCRHQRLQEAEAVVAVAVEVRNNWKKKMILMKKMKRSWWWWSQSQATKRHQRKWESTFYSLDVENIFYIYSHDLFRILLVWLWGFVRYTIHLKLKWKNSLWLYHD